MVLMLIIIMDRGRGKLDSMLGKLDRGLGKLDRGWGKLDRGWGKSFKQIYFFIIKLFVKIQTFPQNLL